MANATGSPPTTDGSRASGDLSGLSRAQRDRRNRILHAALEDLGSRGYEEIQIREVAEAAGVALGTLYRYFPSKEQLFAEALLEWSASFDESIRRRRPGFADDSERLRAVLRRTVRAFEANPNYFGLIGVLEVSTDPAVVATFGEYSDRFGTAVRDALVETADADRPVVADLAVAMVGSSLRSWWLGRRSIRSVYANVDRTVEILFHGVTAEE